MIAPPDSARGIAVHMPRLRHYARILSGSARSGDAYALAALDAVLADPGHAALGAQDQRIALFKAFHSFWQTTGAPGALRGAATPSGLRNLAPNTREALLLNTVEGFSLAEIAMIMSIDRAEARHRVDLGRSQLADADPGSVLIIEDEPIIAMNLEDLVSEAGHRVTGLARTREAAVRLGLAERPDLILADMQLADRSSGRDAVDDLVIIFGDIPVVFITAFPEKLLTGDGEEPAFLISKPFDEEAVRVAMAQALYFSSDLGRPASA